MKESDKDIMTMNTRPPASCYLYDRARYINVINIGLKREEV